MKPWFSIIFSPIISVCCSSDRKAVLAESKNANERFLILTADDFGASININEGIEIAADKQVITTISALTNFTESLPQLNKISENHPEIGIGVHLNITTGKPILSADQVPSLVNGSGSFYSLDELLPVIHKINVDDLRKELRAQVTALTNIGIKVDHLSDQNGILTFYGPFFDILLELAVEFNVPVRSPEIASIKYPALFPNSRMNKYGRHLARQFAVNEPLKAMSLLKYSRLQEIAKKIQKLDLYGIPHPDLLIEYFWGDPTTSNLNYIVEHLPPGTSELILHLGTGARQVNYPGGLDLDYFKNREYELNTITSDYLKGYFKYLNIRTVGYPAIIKAAK
jgi:predicted glycoside hydrolase/deacetylase ChbG (UPF0249 family)